MKRKKSGPEFYYGKDLQSIPVRAIGNWKTGVVASYTGPNSGLTKLDLDAHPITATEVAGVENWNSPSEFAYGISLSLYEEDRPPQSAVQNEEDRSATPPVLVGEPIADVFGIAVHENSAIMALADGCGWGRKPRLAARCAVHAVMEHISSNHARIQSEPNTHTILQLLKEAVTQKAQQLILEHQATLTTLSAAIVCEMAKPGEWGVFVVAVGDSPVYIYCPHTQKVSEVTVGCHPHDGARDLRMAGGCLGPSLGSQPDLANLSVAYMPVYPGDIVFCVSDGVSDNFSSAVMNNSFIEESRISSLCGRASSTKLKSCCEHVCHLTAVLGKHQEKMRHHLSAQTVSACLINHTVEVTDQKRLFRTRCIEQNIDMRRRAADDPEFASQLKSMVGKLDHATIVAYQVGLHR